MKKIKLFFSRFKISLSAARFPLVAAALVAACISMAGAATDTSCDKEDNDYINQRLALCSTHAYNVGLMQNPESPAERETMNEAVKLKSTIITQQMKKQYDFLEVTVRRFKSQLEKAILTSQMEAAGAASGESKSSGTGASSSMTGTRDCSQGSTREKLQCLQQNAGAIYAATSSGTKPPATDVRKQINKDITILHGMVVFIGSTAMYAFKDSNGTATSEWNESCTTNSANASCVQKLQNGIAKLLAAQEQSERAGGGRGY
jgi:hypothetical protein